MPDVVTKGQLAEYLRISTVTIDRHEITGDFKHFDKLGKQRLYRKSDIEEYLSKHNT